MTNDLNDWRFDRELATALALAKELFLAAGGTERGWQNRLAIHGPLGIIALTQNEEGDNNAA